jgi:hypothetical protein
VVVGEIKIDASCLLGDADVHGTLGSVKLRPRFEQFELRSHRLGAQGASRRLVIAATQPVPKALAADGPGFPMTIDHEVRIRDAGGGVKQLITRPSLGEHVGCRQAGA